MTPDRRNTGRGPKDGRRSRRPQSKPDGPGHDQRRRGRYWQTDVPRVWQSRFGVLTENAVPGTRVYREKLFSHKGVELRAWNPRRSKLAALLMHGSNALRLTGEESVLYLGAASGTTVSHISDIVRKGRVYAVEKSARSFRDLLDLARARDNILPLLTDASDTDALAGVVDLGVDLVYQDIAQRAQADMFVRNCARFLRPGGLGVLMVKARSINVAQEPASIYDDVEAALRAAGLKVWERKVLDPYETDHAAVVVHRPES